MNKSELIDVAAAAGDISKAAAAKTLDAFLSTIVTAVSNLPPKYPAAAPSTMPQKTEMPMAIDDTDSDVRAP